MLLLAPGISLIAICMMFGVATAICQHHPSLPSVNLGDTSFLDGVAGPGLLIEEIGDASKEGGMRNAAGALLPNPQSTNAISGTTHVAWLANRKLLGAWYGIEALVVPAHVNAGYGGDVGGIGDLTVSPFILQWKQKQIGSTSIAQRFDFTFNLPVGQYPTKRVE